METMIQPKVTGYRQLSEAEVALMNEGKALAEACGTYIAKLRTHPRQADAHGRHQVLRNATASEPRHGAAIRRRQRAGTHVPPTSAARLPFSVEKHPALAAGH